MSQSNQSTARPSRIVTLKLPERAESSLLWAAGVHPASLTHSRSQIPPSTDTARQSFAGDPSAASVADPTSGDAPRVDYSPDNYQPSATDATGVDAVTGQDDTAIEAATGSLRPSAARNWQTVLNTQRAMTHFRGGLQLPQGESGTPTEPVTASGSGKTQAPSTSADNKW